MGGHLQQAQVAALLNPDGSRADRTAAVRHLLAGCPRCAALARQVLAEHGYRLAAGRLEPPPAEPVAEVSYDAVFDRVIQRLPEMAARAFGARVGP